MITVQADTLTFTLPDSWDEITLGQYIALGDLPDELHLLSILSGHDVATLRSLRAPDLLHLVSEPLLFINGQPDFAELPVPETVTLNGKTITPPTKLGHQTTIGQTFDVAAELKKLDKETEGAEGYVLSDIALPLLGIYLAPIYHNVPYTDIEQAESLHPYLLALPVTTALPLTAFFLRNTQRRQPSGRVSLSVAKTPQPTRVRPKWLNTLRRAFSPSTRVFK